MSAAENPRAVEGDNSSVVAKEKLKAFIERIERLAEERQTFTDDINDVLKEAKGQGFDVRAMRAVVRLRKQDSDELKEQKAILDTYLTALGMDYLL